MHTYPWHVGDFLKDCAHLTDAEDLAYRRLIDLYYTQEAPIPNRTQWVAKRIRMVGQETVVGSVLREFFTLEGSGVEGLWRQKRCDAEITKYQKRVVVNQENGKKGGRKPTGNPPANPLGSKPRTRTRTRNTPQPPEGVVVVFDQFWEQHPRKVGKPKALLAFAAKVAAGAKPEDILAGFLRHLPGWSAKKAAGEGDKIPHPTTWLNRDGWNDEVMPEGAAKGAAGEGGAGWWSTKTGVLERGAQLGLEPPKDDSGWFRFMASVWVAAGDGPWWDKTSVAYPIAVRMREQADAVTGQVMAGLARSGA